MRLVFLKELITDSEAETQSQLTLRCLFLLESDLKITSTLFQ